MVRQTLPSNENAQLSQWFPLALWTYSERYPSWHGVAGMSPSANATIVTQDRSNSAPGKMFGDR
ncbi:protein of unknown function [Hyphomicrobium sp. MC1]|nr:protein of unknown function [Hyphomicrobium sp. MC1]